MKQLIFTFMIFWGLSLSFSSFAEIIDSTKIGFTVRIERAVSADAMTVYQDFTHISKWWDSAHTYSGSAANLSLQSYAGGCFCENLENNGSVEHMKVIYSVPGKIIRMEGGIGPLQQFPVTGIMTLEIRTDEQKTMVTFTYTVGGYITGGCAKFAEIVDKVLGRQFERFINVVNSGK